jgi:HSP20 family protein
MSRTIEKILHESIAAAARSAVASESTWSPNTDVYENPEALVVTLEIAGVAVDDLDVTLKDRLLVVRGFRKDPCRKKPCRYRQLEIDYGFFERCVVVPCAVDGRRARAQCHNGFLHIELPKADEPVLGHVTVIIERLE